MVIIRNLLGALFFFVLFPVIRDQAHQRSQLAQPALRKLIILYSLIVIIGTQILRYKSLQQLPVTKAAVFLLIKPLIGVILTILILQEPLLHRQIIGGGIVLVGLALSMIHGHKSGRHAHSGIIHDHIKH